MSRQGKSGKSTKRRSRSAPSAAAARIGAVPREGAAPRSDLGSIRTQIDAIDARIHELLNERARFAQQVGISKTAGGKAVDFYRPEREAQVLRKALERNRGPLRNEEIARLFREIMSACLAQQEPLKVAFLGPEGTFTQAAVLKHFGSSVRALPLPAIDEVFHEVEGGIADFGVVPIENSSEGTVNHTLDMFLGSALKICGEVELRFNHHLMGRMSALARGQARVRTRPGARAVPRLAGRASARAPSVSPSRATRRARGAPATSAARPQSRAVPQRRSTASTLLAERDRGPAPTTPPGSW